VDGYWEKRIGPSSATRPTIPCTAAAPGTTVTVAEICSPGASTGRQALHVVEEEGHRLADRWYAAGAQFLLRQARPHLTQ
jgi:hypothetical protein